VYTSQTNTNRQLQCVLQHFGLVKLHRVVKAIRPRLLRLVASQSIKHSNFCVTQRRFAATSIRNTSRAFPSSSHLPFRSSNRDGNELNRDEVGDLFENVTNFNMQN
jgi:hypothetical protein